MQSLNSFKKYIYKKTNLKSVESLLRSKALGN